MYHNIQQRANRLTWTVSPERSGGSLGAPTCTLHMIVHNGKESCSEREERRDDASLSCTSLRTVRGYCSITAGCLSL
jgi:hypothetical protein